jgi:hypothetical protein
MRPFLFLLAAICATAAPEPPPERKCTLRLAWWANPSERIELAVVQGKSIVPVVALEMNLDLTKEYSGPAQLTIVRKKGEAQKVLPFDPEKLYAQPAAAPPKPDAKAKPEPTKKEKADEWEPFTIVALPESGDVGVLLLMSPDGKCAGRAFDYEAGRFPYGSIRVVNLSASTLAGEIDTKPFKVAAGAADLLPIVFRERTTSHIKLAALLAGNDVEPILGTKIAGRPNRRSLVFVMQTGVSDNKRPLFESRSIENVEPVLPEAISPPGKARAK